MTIVLLEGSLLLTEELWSSDQVTIRFLVKNLLSKSLSLYAGSALVRVLLVPSFYQSGMMETTVTLVTHSHLHLFSYQQLNLLLVDDYSDILTFFHELLFLFSSSSKTPN